MARGFAEGVMVGAAGVGLAGVFQSPKVFSARAKPWAGVILPVSTRTALSGR